MTEIDVPFAYTVGIHGDIERKGWCLLEVDEESPTYSLLRYSPNEIDIDGVKAQVTDYMAEKHPGLREAE